MLNFQKSCNLKELLDLIPYNTDLNDAGTNLKFLMEKLENKKERKVEEKQLLLKELEEARYC